MSDDIWIQCDNCGRILKDAMRETSAEIATLNRQVEVLAKKISEHYAYSPNPATFAGYLNHCEKLRMSERTQKWIKWSLEQAKKGGAG